MRFRRVTIACCCASSSMLLLLGAAGLHTIPYRLDSAGIMRIRQAAVLGAGVMGAQIAAHFANAGLRVLLLDVTRDAARDGLQRATKLKPDPFFTPGGVSLIRT